MKVNIIVIVTDVWGVWASDFGQLVWKSYLIFTKILYGL
jgi:hypothetical protein